MKVRLWAGYLGRLLGPVIGAGYRRASARESCAGRVDRAPRVGSGPCIQRMSRIDAKPGSGMISTTESQATHEALRWRARVGGIGTVHAIAQFSDG